MLLTQTCNNFHLERAIAFNLEMRQPSSLDMSQPSHYTCDCLYLGHVITFIFKHVMAFVLNFNIFPLRHAIVFILDMHNLHLSNAITFNFKHVIAFIFKYAIDFFLDIRYPFLYTCDKSLQTYDNTSFRLLITFSIDPQLHFFGKLSCKTLLRLPNQWV